MAAGAGTPFAAHGFTGRILFDEADYVGTIWSQAPAGSINTEACVWLPPNDYRFHLRGDEQTGTAQLALAWRMLSGRDPWDWSQISNTWVNRDPLIP